jgi:hypothetical protein
VIRYAPVLLLHDQILAASVALQVLFGYKIAAKTDTIKKKTKTKETVTDFTCYSQYCWQSRRRKTQEIVADSTCYSKYCLQSRRSKTKEIVTDSICYSKIQFQAASSAALPLLFGYKNGSKY